MLYKGLNISIYLKINAFANSKEYSFCPRRTFKCGGVSYKAVGFPCSHSQFFWLEDLKIASWRLLEQDTTVKCLLLLRDGRAAVRPSVQLAAPLCPTLRDPMDYMPGLPVHHQLPELAQTHVHRVSDAIQPSHAVSSPPPAFDPSQHQGLFQWVSSSHQVAKVL